MLNVAKWEEHKRVVRRLYELINQNAGQGFGEVIAPDHIDHSNNANGPEGFARGAARIHRAYSPFNIALEELIAADDLVAARWREHGVHVGQFFNLKPTGKAFETTGINIYRVRDGKIVESWLAIDPKSIRAQQTAQQALRE